MNLVNVATLQAEGDQPLPIIARPTVGKNNSRHNPYSKLYAPEGYMQCLHPRCRLLVPISGSMVECEDGHSFNLQEEDRRRREPGGWTTCGLSLRELGQLGENIVFELGDLGELGRIDPERWIPDELKPMDGFTTQGDAIEVKTCDHDAGSHAYNPGGKRDKARKLEYARKQGAKRIIGVCVVPNFRMSLAEIHLRWWTDAIRYFSIKPDHIPFAVVSFEDKNPFIEKPIPDELPF